MDILGILERPKENQMQCQKKVRTSRRDTQRLQHTPIISYVLIIRGFR